MAHAPNKPAAPKPAAPLGVPQKGVARPQGGSVAIGGKPVTPAMWQSGALANALAPGHDYGYGPGVLSPPAASSASPPDPVLEGLIGSAGRRRDDLLAQYAAQRPQALADYGYTASGYDSSGAPTGLTFDPNNPFSKAALLKQRYDQQQAGTTNSLAARGQLYSGALQGARAYNERGNLQANDALQKALTRLLTGISRGETGAKTDYETAVAQYRGQRAPTS